MQSVLGGVQSTDFEQQTLHQDCSVHYVCRVMNIQRKKKQDNW